MTTTANEIKTNVEEQQVIRQHGMNRTIVHEELVKEEKASADVEGARDHQSFTPEASLQTFHSKCKEAIDGEDNNSEQTVDEENKSIKLQRTAVGQYQDGSNSLHICNLSQFPSVIGCVCRQQGADPLAELKMHFEGSGFKTFHFSHFES